MHQPFQVDIALALEAVEYIAGVSVSQRLYVKYIALWFRLA
jgi:hypothetical protein